MSSRPGPDTDGELARFLRVVDLPREASDFRSALGFSAPPQGGARPKDPKVRVVEDVGVAIQYLFARGHGETHENAIESVAEKLEMKVGTVKAAVTRGSKYLRSQPMIASSLARGGGYFRYLAKGRQRPQS